jgi:pSer/pThr/pTyr-binding forkhead associated (FHA) protein
MTQGGRSFLLQGGTSTIGRSLDNTIVLADTCVSRRHAEIRWDASGVYVRDVRSANGTKVDGLRLQPGEWRAVYPNSQVVLGDEVRCQVTADAPVSSPSARHASDYTGR